MHSAGRITVHGAEESDVETLQARAAFVDTEGQLGTNARSIKGGKLKALLVHICQMSIRVPAHDVLYLMYSFDTFQALLKGEFCHLLFLLTGISFV
jgi:hypothetical protein